MLLVSWWSDDCKCVFLTVCVQTHFHRAVGGEIRHNDKRTRLHNLHGTSLWADRAVLPLPSMFFSYFDSFIDETSDTLDLKHWKQPIKTLQRPWQGGLLHIYLISCVLNGMTASSNHFLKVKSKQSERWFTYCEVSALFWSGRCK